jgi:hypothetical protein
MQSILKLLGMSKGYQTVDQKDDVDVSAEERQKAAPEKGVQRLLDVAEKSVNEFVKKGLPSLSENYRLTHLLGGDKKDTKKIMTTLEEDYRFTQYTQMKKNIKDAENILSTSQKQLSGADHLKFQNKLVHFNTVLKPYHDLVIKDFNELKGQLRGREPKDGKYDSYSEYMRPFVENLKVALKKFEEVFKDILPAPEVAVQPAVAAAPATATSAAAAYLAVVAATPKK